MVAWLGNIRITLRPFSVSFSNWREMVGWVLIIIGLQFFKWDIGRKAREDGYNKCKEDVMQIISDEQIKRGL